MARPHNSETQTLIGTAVEIAEERSKLLGLVKAKLQAGDDPGALRLMREYCGLTDTENATEGQDETSDRANPRLN